MCDLPRREFLAGTVAIAVFTSHVLFGARQAAADPSDAAPETTAVFSVHPDNHRVFMYQGTPMKILTSAEHYGAVVNGDFDCDVYLKEMQRTGQNMTRAFAFYRETAESLHHAGRSHGCRVSGAACSQAG